MLRLRSRFTYANVMSTIAVFLALTGGTAAIALSGKNQVKKDDIAKGAVRSDDIAKNAVGSSDVAADSLGASDLAAGGVGASELADGAVGSADIAGGAVGPSQLGGVPAARVSLSTPQTVPHNMVEGVDFDTDSDPLNPRNEYDPNGMWDPSDANSVYVPRDGLYLVTARVVWAFDNTADVDVIGDQGSRELRIGSLSAQSPDSIVDAVRSPSTFTHHQASGVLNLKTGDDLGVALAQQNEDLSSVDALAVYFEVTWLGPGV